MSALEDFKKPINIISLSIGLLSITISLYLYFASLKSMEPVFLIDEQRGQIFDSSITSPAIKVLDKEDQIIDEDVYLTSAVLWNAGELPIEPKDIRQEFRLKLLNTKRILDYSITKEVDSSISNFKLAKIDPTTLAITWKHFDPGHGMRVQVIYVGRKDSSVKFEGKTVNTEIKNVEPFSRKHKVFEILLGVIPAIFGAIIFEIGKSVPKQYRENKGKAIVQSILIFILISLLIIAFRYIFSGPTPPV